MTPTLPFLPLPVLVDSPEVRARVYGRLHRWATTTDPRIVQRLWPRQEAGADRALCPGCGVVLRDGMLVTLNQMTTAFPAGPAYRALAAGDVDALTADLPIEPGELWCVVCLPCLEDHPQTPRAPSLRARLEALIDEALQSNRPPPSTRYTAGAAA